MMNTTNPQLELAFDYIQHTDKNIFLTGKAGTGKTTFLHRVKRECIKRIAVVAPTGIAAINARGMTIHSLFQLPFGPYLPGLKKEISRTRRFSKKKVNLIRSLDLLIIDEISMVRADVLDGIDDVLRRYKDFNKPFGGIQLLMIGDLHQLPPVVKPNEWDLLKEYYSTPYFFGSNALKRKDLITIQLTHIYRQSDTTFINLLNKVRNNQLDEEVLNTLNGRYIFNFQPSEDEGYITLTSHNRTAQAHNEEKLKALSETAHGFKAIIKGEFPEHAYPTGEVLELKKGAQVLFIKNDPTPEKRYYNGKIGRITCISEKEIYVKCPNEPKAISVPRLEWKNVKYSLNESTKEVSEDEKGSFIQYPLKLAWAITIHKSQGLTFERVIIDAQAAFAHGQVYVALSRCKSFEGIVLRSKIGFSSVKTDVVVKDYSKKAEENAPDEDHLNQSKQVYQQSLIGELFSFPSVRKAVNVLRRTYFEYEKNLTTEALNQVKEWENRLSSEIFSIANRFRPELQKYFEETELPENNKNLTERIKKASAYFSEKLNQELLLDLRKIPVLTDNQAIKKQASEHLKNLKKALFVKNACFKMAQTDFSTQNYIKVKANAALDFDNQKPMPSNTLGSVSIPKGILHPELYLQLRKWREALAGDLETTPFEIISTMSLMELTKFLPTDKAGLKRIKGLGLLKIQRYGGGMIEVIEKYCKQKGIAANLMTASSKPKPNSTIPEKAYSVEVIRQTQQNAYKPWSEEEETELISLRNDGKLIKDIAAALGRNKGAISSRLKKIKERQ